MEKNCEYHSSADSTKGSALKYQVRYQVAHGGPLMYIHVIFTCFNRAEKTKKCILSLLAGNPLIDIHFIVVNDGSTDNTAQVLDELNNNHKCITVLNGNGSLFYSKGMRKGMEWLNASDDKSDYVMLVNDDVEFKPHAIEKLIEESRQKNNAIIVSATHDDNGNFTYGGAKYKKGFIHYDLMSCEQSDEPCDTFNANCVLIPWDWYTSVEPMDGYYAHSTGDFDYGFSLSRAGAYIYTSGFYVGSCNRNPSKGTWNDTSLSRIDRLKKKESPKGLPLSSWLHFLHKNFGMKQAILHGFTPYIRILIGK